MDRADFASLVNHDQAPVEFKDWGPSHRVKVWSKAPLAHIQRELRKRYGNDLIFISPPCLGHSRPIGRRRK